MKNIFKSSDVIVKQIHDEIDQAQDNLLDQAKKIIADTEIKLQSGGEDKAKRLSAIGFINSLLVNQNKILVKTKEDVELIEYYKLAYPFQKFITEQEMDRICDKYGLIYASVERYLKDVPDPIVFRYCRGGIQVISKWGLEANDEIVSNPIHN